MLDDGILDRDVFESVRHAKRAVIEHTGVLEYFPSDERLDEVAGLGALKRWLEQRAVAFREPARAREFGLTPPRGILLIGVQGCGAIGVSKDGSVVVGYSGSDADPRPWSAIRCPGFIARLLEGFDAAP